MTICTSQVCWHVTWDKTCRKSDQSKCLITVIHLWPPDSKKRFSVCTDFKSHRGSPLIQVTLSLKYGCKVTSRIKIYICSKYTIEQYTNPILNHWENSGTGHQASKEQEESVSGKGKDRGGWPLGHQRKKGQSLSVQCLRNHGQG